MLDKFARGVYARWLAHASGFAKTRHLPSEIESVATLRWPCLRRFHGLGAPAASPMQSGRTPTSRPPYSEFWPRGDYAKSVSRNASASKNKTSASGDRQASAGSPAFILQHSDRNSSAVHPRSSATFGRKHPDRPP